VALKLYYGGFGDSFVFTAAENEASAIIKIGEKINAPFLPITAQEISEVDGYGISFCGCDVKTEAPVSETPQETETIDEATVRHCKKCDFTCETQGELLKHYREIHPKGD